MEHSQTQALEVVWLQRSIRAAFSQCASLQCLHLLGKCSLTITIKAPVTLWVRFPSGRKYNFTAWALNWMQPNKTKRAVLRKSLPPWMRLVSKKWQWFGIFFNYYYFLSLDLDRVYIKTLIMLILIKWNYCLEGQTYLKQYSCKWR